MRSEETTTVRIGPVGAVSATVSVRATVALTAAVSVSVVVVVTVVPALVAAVSPVVDGFGTMMGWQAAVNTTRAVQTDKSKLRVNMLHLWGRIRMN